MMRNAVRRIEVDNPGVYAFEINGQVSAAEMESMAKTMNTAFDASDDKVDMMLVFIDYDGSEGGAMFDRDVISSRFRALTHVDKYVVVGAPEKARYMLDILDELIPVDAHTFELSEIDKAWELLGVSRAELAT